jgi:hypothetical protein
MFDNCVTDSCFELADRLECKKKWYNPVIWGTLIIAPAILGLDILVFQVLSHQKGSSSDATIVLIALVAALCLILIVATVKKYLVLKRLKKSLKELESFEIIIYQEVLKQDEHLLAQ